MRYSLPILRKLEWQQKVKSAMWTALPAGKWDALANQHGERAGTEARVARE